MGLFSFIKKKANEIKEDNKLSKELKLVKIQGEKEYSRKLAEIYSLKNTDEINTLHKSEAEYNVQPHFQKSEMEKQFKTYAVSLLKEPSLSPKVFDEFCKITETFNITIPQEEFYIFKRKNLIWLANNNLTLPELDNDTIELPLKKNEIAHLADYSHLRKIVTRTQKVGYAGPAVSFKICKGVRYRAGLFDVGKTTSTTIDTIDEGIFYITNKRIAFVGNTKNFSYPISKIIKAEMTSNGILIQKENTVNPQIVALDEYELPLSILSMLMNE